MKLKLLQLWRLADYRFLNFFGACLMERNPPTISLIWDCIFALEFAAEVLFFY